MTDVTANEPIAARTRRLEDAVTAARAATPGRASWPPACPDPFPSVQDQLVEVDAADLDAATLGGAVLHHGCLIVRGLLDEDGVAAADAALGDAFDAQARFYADTPGPAEGDEWYSPLPTEVPSDRLMRRANANAGALWLADSPRATQVVLELLHRTAVPGVLHEHFGEPALFSLQKTTLRSVPPEERLTTWHQDGAFMGADIRTMNLWVALTDCGGDVPASGMEMIPRRVEEILDTTGGIVPHAVPFETVDEIAAESGVVNPRFRAGDAAFFDERFLHRTALGPGLSQTRRALECWFFATSSFAEDYTALAV